MALREKRKLRQIREWVATQVSPYRFKHIQGVARASEKLARLNNLPAEKARLAAWLHDCGKELDRKQMFSWLQKGGFALDALELQMTGLWHPHVGAAIAKKKWGIRDPAVLEAIRCHTLGKAGMGPLAEVVFVADFIEPGRDFQGVAEARRVSARNLRKGVLTKAAMTIGFLLAKGMKIHPRLLETWNDYLEP